MTEIDLDILPKRDTLSKYDDFSHFPSGGRSLIDAEGVVGVTKEGYYKFGFTTEFLNAEKFVSKISKRIENFAIVDEPIIMSICNAGLEDYMGFSGAQRFANITGKTVLASKGSVLNIITDGKIKEILSDEPFNLYKPDNYILRNFFNKGGW